MNEEQSQIRNNFLRGLTVRLEKEEYNVLIHDHLPMATKYLAHILLSIDWQTNLDLNPNLTDYYTKLCSQSTQPQ